MNKKAAIEIIKKLKKYKNLSEKEKIEKSDYKARITTFF